MATTKEVWFPAKKYGWGWGIPRTWQGWFVLVAFAVVLVVARIWFPPQTAPVAFYMLLGLDTVGLLVACYLKGEPPRWRWGEE
jgi:hypothetical protein